MNAYFNAMRRYFDFSGRSTRRQFWLFWLVYWGLSMIALLVDGALGLETTNGEPVSGVTAVVVLAHAVPSLALLARRLHDIGHSGWWGLLWIIPPLGFVASFVIGCLRSQAGDNRFGAHPAAHPGTPATAAAEAPREASQSSAEPDQLAQIEKLAALRDSGAIDDEEYRSMKADVLSKA